MKDIPLHKKIGYKITAIKWVDADTAFKCEYIYKIIEEVITSHNKEREEFNKTKNEILAKKIAYAIWYTIRYNKGSVTGAMIAIQQVLDQEDALQALADQAQELDMGYGKSDNQNELK